ncbi:MAG: hypothetical protein FIB06_14350 [Betaproteobacteria bacterium]|nr:hypothetical protein [Betaproteobacteria bacterium]
MSFFQRISAALAAVVAVLPGCDIGLNQDIKPGITTADEVRTRMGEPGFEFRNNDGSTTWEYTRQPMGVHCYMVTLGPDRIVTRFEQVLNDASYARAREGMERDAIRRLLGKPARIEVFDNLREEVWEWRIEGMPHNELTYFNVYFDTSTGLVKKAGKRVEVKG